MIVLAFEGLPNGIASRFPDSRFWRVIDVQFQHTWWAGCAFWDLIQPAFMFMVGMSIPYSMMARRKAGQPAGLVWAGVVRRSMILLVSGLVIISNGLPQTDFTFVHDALLQIGLAYPFAYLLATRGRRTQVVAAAGLLVGCWLVYALHPVRPLAPDVLAQAAANGGTQFSGFFAHWNRYSNVGEDFDRWFLNLFPRPEPFLFDKTGLTTINFIPSIVTMMAGVWASDVLNSAGNGTRKLQTLATAGLACLAAGWILGQTVCPIIKAIWTPSWVVFSSGWTVLMLAGFYAVIEVQERRRWVWPLVAVGMNSLAMYVMIRLLKPWLWRTLTLHLGDFSWATQMVVVVGLLWAVTVWMYRKRIVITA